MALNESQVNIAYKTYLGRDPTPEELNSFVGKKIDPSKVTDSIISSQEYQSLTPEDHVQRQFMDVLHRAPTESELQRVLSNEDYVSSGKYTYGTGSPYFRSDKFRQDIASLPEADLIRVYNTYLGRDPDEEAYKNYLKPDEPSTIGMGGTKQSLVDTPYAYAVDPKRLEEVGWSPEAQEYINNKFDAQARSYAEQKGIELPENFSVLAQYRNPWQDNRAGLFGMNVSMATKYGSPYAYRSQVPEDYEVWSAADKYKLPVYAMQYTRAGGAAFDDEDKAAEAAAEWGPEAAVEAYASDPANFMKEAAAGVYANNWLEQNIDPKYTEAGGNKDKLANLAEKYKSISQQAIDAGANPEDIAKYTSSHVSNVAGEWQKYYRDTHEDNLGLFLLLAGGLALGSLALSNLGTAGAAGATGAGAGTTGGGFIGGGYGSVGIGGHTALAGAGAAIPGYSSTNIPTDIFSKPTLPVGGGGASGEMLGSGLKIPAGQGFAPELGSTVGAGATPIGTGSVGLKAAPGLLAPSLTTTATGSLTQILNKAKGLTDLVGGGDQQKQETQVSGGAPVYRNPNELIPVSNIMISPEKWREMTTTRPTFLGGLGAMRNLT